MLLLCAAVGASLVVHGGACLAGENRGRGASMVGLLALMIGAARLIGFLAPGGLVSLGLALSWLPPFNPNVFGGAPGTIFLT